VKNVNREKRRGRIRRHRRVREKVHGTAEKPRLCVYRSLLHIYAQIIDDDARRTLAYASSRAIELPQAAEVPDKASDKAPEKGKGGKKEKPLSKKMLRSRAVGKAIAEAALAKGIKTVAFDRGGYLYHGRVSALAEAARKAGLEF
jgi:large subunit ribosomal protein L18